MRCSLLNIEGIISKNTNKLECEEVRSLFASNDIVFLTETWGNTMLDLSVDNFECFHLHRTEKHSRAKRDSGGLAIYIRDKYVDGDNFFLKSGDDIIWVKLGKNTTGFDFDLFIGLCYIVPDGTCRTPLVETNTLDRLSDSLLYYENNKTESRCFLLGDFNARTACDPDYVVDDTTEKAYNLPDDYVCDVPMQRFSQDLRRPYGNGINLLEFCKKTGMRIMNGRCGDDKNIGKYTYVGHRGSSVIDYILAPAETIQYFTKFCVDEPNILSDHCCIHFDFSPKCRAQNTETCNISNHENLSLLTRKMIWNCEKANDFKQMMSTDDIIHKLINLNRDIDVCSSTNDIDNCVNNLVNIFVDVGNPLFEKKISHKPKGTRSSHSPNKWFTDRCSEMKLNFHQKLNLYRLTKTDQTRIELVRARSEYKSTIRQAKYNFRKEETSRLINAKYKNARLYWKMLKDSQGPKKCTIDMDTFAKFFEKINNPSEDFFKPDPDVLEFNEKYHNGELPIIFEELNGTISLDEIREAVNQTKTGKSGGPDLLLNEFLKHGFDVCLQVFHTLFNKIFGYGYFPKSWAEGYIIPLHKKGSINDVKNYRGITLLSTLGKLFTRILNNRLNNWAEKYRIYIDAQAGFRKNMSTVDNIFVLNGLITKAIGNHGKLFCAFIDFSKAFDYVVRENLWQKLIKSGVRGKMLDVIISMYQNIKSKVKFDNKLSKEFTCSLGVRQGECLSPFLFSIFLNDIENEFVMSGIEGMDIGMLNMFLLLYADDMTIIAKSETDLQQGLDLLYNYCKRWRLIVNIEKSKVMVFRKGGTLSRNMEFRYDGQIIEISKKITYLGITFTPGGSYAETQKNLSGKALKATFALEKYLYKYTDIGPKHVLELFDKLVSPIMSYGSEVWGFIRADNIERIHTQFCKKVLGVKKSTQNDFVYGELGRHECIVNRYYQIIKYWLKVVESDDTKYVWQIYNAQKADIELNRNINNWANNVRKLLCVLGFNYAWIFQEVGDKRKFLLTVKQRLTDNSIQNWDIRLQESTRALFYRHISIHKFQDYLFVIKSKKVRNAVSQLRVSSHRLQIEAGRWTKPKTQISERKCKCCNDLEDEFHFTLQCPLYTEIRKAYIPKYFWQRPNMYKFIELVTSQREKLILNFGIYIYKAFKVRNDYMYSNKR